MPISFATQPRTCSPYILDISKLQSGKYTVDSKAVDLDEVLQPSLAALKPAAIARGILMESKLNAALPSVRGDAGKLRQVFSYLINNSIKFTTAGGSVTLAAQALEDGGVSGDGVTLPVRIKFDELPAHAMPRSSSARFMEMWQKSVGDAGFLDSIVDRWRNASSAADAVQSASMFAESV